MDGIKTADTSASLTSSKVLLNKVKVEGLKNWFKKDEELSNYLDNRFGKGNYELVNGEVYKIGEPPKEHRDLKESKTLQIIAMNLAYPEWSRKELLEKSGLKSIGDLGARLKKMYTIKPDTDEYKVINELREKYLTEKNGTPETNEAVY